LYRVFSVVDVKTIKCNARTGVWRSADRVLNLEGLVALGPLLRLREGFYHRQFEKAAWQRLVCSTLRTTRRVLQTSQKWPDTAGSKCRGFAKLGERFQWPSPKAVVLPLHHSPIIAQRHQYVRCHLGKCSRPPDPRIPRTGALLPATSRPWQARRDSVVAAGPGKSRVICGGRAAVRAGAYERFFRRA
jgi:hypothetical protein